MTLCGGTVGIIGIDPHRTAGSRSIRSILLRHRSPKQQRAVSAALVVVSALGTAAVVAAAAAAAPSSSSLYSHPASRRHQPHSRRLESAAAAAPSRSLFPVSSCFVGLGRLDMTKRRVVSSAALLGSGIEEQSERRRSSWQRRASFAPPPAVMASASRRLPLAMSMSTTVAESSEDGGDVALGNDVGDDALLLHDDDVDDGPLEDHNSDEEPLTEDATDTDGSRYYGSEAFTSAVKEMFDDAPKQTRNQRLMRDFKNGGGDLEEVRGFLLEPVSILMSSPKQDDDGGGNGGGGGGSGGDDNLWRSSPPWRRSPSSSSPSLSRSERSDLVRRWLRSRRDSHFPADPSPPSTAETTTTVDTTTASTATTTATATGLTPDRHRLATRSLAYLADRCAKNKSPRAMCGAWYKSVDAGMVPLERTLSTFLYVLSLDDDGEDSEGTDDVGKGDDAVSAVKAEAEAEAWKREKEDVAADVAAFHDALYEPTEKTTALLVKSFISKGDARGAEALLDGIEVVDDEKTTGGLRHRTALPILQLYCKQGDMSSALRLYSRMRRAEGVKMEAATYADFVAAVAENGYFGSNSEPIEGALSLGYDPAYGSGLLDRLVADIAEDVLDISEQSALVIRNGFVKGFATDDNDNDLSLTSPEDLRPLRSSPGGEGGAAQLVADRVEVDHETAECPATSVKLRLIVLEEDQRIQVLDTLLEMAKAKSEEYTAKMLSKGRIPKQDGEQADRASQILKEFADWLDTREGEPFTAIVDGANVGYYGWGKVNLFQLRLMVEALEERNEHPLVIMPQKYTRKSFYLRKNVIQKLKDEELEIYSSLKEKGQLYVVPPMCLDDLYWMLASVSDQTASTNGTSINVPLDNEEGRSPGTRPLLISNDKMRDHRLELLEERLFRRWCSSHVVNYNFTEYIDNQWDERDVSFQPADYFSHEIQGNQCPDGGTAWHFPVSEWGENDRFCLRLPCEMKSSVETVI